MDAILAGNQAHIQALDIRYTTGHPSYTSTGVLTTPQNTNAPFPVLTPPKEIPGTTLLPAGPQTMQVTWHTS